MRNVGRIIAAAALAGLIVVPTGAQGQTDQGEVGQGGSQQASAQAASTVVQPIEASTTYVHPTSNAAPNGALSLANASLVCLFVPCPPEAAEAMAILSDPLLATQDIHGQNSPYQAVQPGTVVVSLSLGSTQYESAIKFSVPPPPSGDQYEQFDVVLQQTNPTFHANSPTFRAAMNAAFILVRDENPEAASAKLQEGLTSTPVDQKVLEVRACPLKVAFDPTEAPEVNQASSIPRDEFGAVELACHYGAFGEYDGAGSWSFDLTRAANAWSTGEIENHGLFLMPVITNYMGIGDEDPSTNAQVSFLADEVSVDVALAPKSPGFTFPEESSESAPTTPAGPGQSAAGPFVSAPAPGGMTPVAPAPETADPSVAAPPAAPAPPVVAVGFDNSGFGAQEVAEWLVWTALIIIVSSGSSAYQWVRRRRARPIPVGLAL